MVATVCSASPVGTTSVTLWPRACRASTMPKMAIVCDLMPLVATAILSGLTSWGRLPADAAPQIAARASKHTAVVVGVRIVVVIARSSSVAVLDAVNWHASDPKVERPSPSSPSPQPER